MKQTLLALLGSILRAAAVSTVFAGFAFLTKQSMLTWFTVSFIGQFIVFYLYGVYLEYKSVKDKRDLQLKELEILSKITFNVPCAACKHFNEVVINPNDDLKFTCVQCEVENAVYINVESAVITQPINTNI
jgi:hypothetical protein